MIIRFAAGAWLASAAAAFQPANAQDYGAVGQCKLIPDSAARLQCYDKAIADADKQASGAVLDDGNWHISESRSNDGSPQLAAVLQATEATGALVVRCQDHVTDTYVTLASKIAGTSPVAVSIKINTGGPIDTRWLPATEGNAVFAATQQAAIGFIRAMPDEGTIVLVVGDPQAHPTQMTFKLGPVADVRDKIATYCNWPPEMRVPVTPPPAAPAAPKSSIKLVPVQPHQQHWSTTAQHR